MEAARRIVGLKRERLRLGRRDSVRGLSKCALRAGTIGVSRVKDDAFMPSSPFDSFGQQWLHGHENYRGDDISLGHVNKFVCPSLSMTFKSVQDLRTCRRNISKCGLAGPSESCCRRYARRSCRRGGWE
jgi:hypothetical protein